MLILLDLVLFQINEFYFITDIVLLLLLVVVINYAILLLLLPLSFKSVLKRFIFIEVKKWKNNYKKQIFQV